MISEKNNTFVLRSYVRILEYDVLFYYLLYNIIAINSLTKIDLKLLNRKLYNNPGLPDEKQKQLISNLEKRFNKLKNNIARQLKKYEINENFNGSNFYNFVQILERDKLYIFKQYCIGHNRKTRKEINSLKYNDYEDIGKFICIKSVGDIDKQFELSILDKYNLKYDTYKHHQSKEYSYYQTIAQPLVFHIDKENGDYNIKTILTNIRDEDENIQKKIDETHDNAPSTKICFGKGFSGEPSKEYKGFYNHTKRFLNQPENASVKYNMEIQNPKLTKKTPLNYSRGVDTYLHNKIEKDKYFTQFVLDKQQFSSGDGGKTRNLMEQIKDNIKIIKKFKHLILKKLYQYKELHPHLTKDLLKKDLKPIQIMVNEYLGKIIPDNIIESLIIEKRPYKYELNKVIKPYAIFESRLDTSSEVESLWSRREPVSEAIFKCPRINCPLADKEFSSLQALFLHTRAYHSGNMWVCPRISNGNPSGKEFKTLQDLREHDIKCHPIDKEPDKSCSDDGKESDDDDDEEDDDEDDDSADGSEDGDESKDDSEEEEEDEPEDSSDHESESENKSKIFQIEVDDAGTKKKVPIYFFGEINDIESRLQSEFQKALVIFLTYDEDKAGNKAGNNTFGIYLKGKYESDGTIDVKEAEISIKSQIIKAVKYYINNESKYNCIAHPGTQSKTNYYKNYSKKLKSDSIYEPLKTEKVTQTTIITIDSNKLENTTTDDLITYAGSTTNVKLEKCEGPLDFINDKIDNFFNEHKPSASESSHLSEPTLKENATKYLKEIYKCYNSKQMLEDSEGLECIKKLREIFIKSRVSLREDINELEAQQDASEFIIKMIEILKFEDIFKITETDTKSCIKPTDSGENVLKTIKYDVAKHNFIITNKIFGADSKKIDKDKLKLKIQDKMVTSGKEFKLTGFIVHIGVNTISNGHYICYIKSRNDKWYEISDNDVNEKSLDFPITIIDNHYPFVLFYSSKVPSIEDTPKGIHNLGNTCYINSVLQNLFNIRAVTDML